MAALPSTRGTQYVLARWAWVRGVRKLEFWNEPDLSASCITCAPACARRPSGRPLLASLRLVAPRALLASRQPLWEP